jgi:hypothetical protein
MARRLAGRVLLFAALALIVMLLVGEMKALATTASGDPGHLLQRDQVAAVQRSVEARPEQAPDASPSSAVVLVFVGIVFMAALPPVYGVHVYQRTYHRY